MTPRKMTFDEFLDKVSEALFDDLDEPGCHDTMQGDMVISEIGAIRLKKIWKELRGK